MREARRERRVSRRRIRRVSCEIEFEGKTHSAVIRDLTAQGLFVTTRFEAEPGTSVDVRVRRPGGEIWEIRARTARVARRESGLVSDRGMGLQIEEAPLAFHEFVSEIHS